MPKQILAITTCRVSTPEQMENHSLERQAKAVVDAATELDAVIPDDGQWSLSVSSKAGTNVSRKDLREMLEYCKSHPQVRYLIVHEVDRFMRSVDELFHYEVLFREFGVTVWYASQPELNTGEVYAKLLKALEAFKGEGSNLERHKKSIDGDKMALEQGRYPFAPKPGYMKGRLPAIQDPHPIRGPILKSALISIVTKRKTPTQALIDLNASEFTKDHSPYKMDKFRKIVTDPFYAGIVEVNRQFHIRNENGLHEPLITKAQHNQLIEIMSGKPKNQIGPRKGGNPDYPLSNQVSCLECKEARNGRVAGYKHSNGKSSTLVWHKYRCRACGRYQSREELHTKVSKLFNDRSVTNRGKNDLLKALNKVWEQNESQAKQDALRLEHRISDVEKQIEEKVIASTQPKYSAIADDILKVVAKLKIELADLQDQHQALTTTANEDNEQFLDFAFDFLGDMGENFFNTDVSLENRLRCKQVIFPAGFWVDKNKRVYTPEISYLYRLATNEKDAVASSKSQLVQEAVRERNPNVDMDALVEALLDPVAQRARQLALRPQRD